MLFFTSSQEDTRVGSICLTEAAAAWRSHGPCC